MPILKGKPGEFIAWQKADEQVLDSTRPIFEVVPTKGADVDLAKFLQDAVGHWPVGRLLSFDTSALDQDAVPGTETSPLTWLAGELSERDITARPVVHLDDPDGVLQAAGAAHELHGAGVCVRAGSEEQDPDVETCALELPRLLDVSGLARRDIDLLFDFRFVDSPKTLQRVNGTARQLVQWATRDDEPAWRSVTVACGAFPSSISHLPTDGQTALRRLDADLWCELSDLPVRPGYGDYGVANPSMPVSVPRGPLPNLRYTHAEQWWVWREKKTLPGNESMRTLCARVMQSDFWPATGEAYSWGDAEIARLSRSEGGAGTATQWRAWGTSHHLAVVTDRLATLNVP